MTSEHKLDPKLQALTSLEATIAKLGEYSTIIKEDYSEETRLDDYIKGLKPAHDYLVALASQPATTPILVGTGVTLACSNCFRINASAYYLKRSAGKYVVLCFDRGNGCWEKSSRTCCSYVDQHSAQCDELVEWEVVYGQDGMSRRGVCAAHVGAVLTGDVSQYKIYPVDND